VSKPTASFNSFLFTYGKVKYGDEKLVRGITVRCGYCYATDDIPVNGFSTTSGIDDSQELRFITRKLENMGWKVGRTPSQHRCPKCYTAIKVSSARKREEATVAEKSTPENKVVTLTPGSPPSDQRPMTRDDRRIIFEKLNEVYVGEKVGYAPGWTDHKVASDLGVPRNWVRLIRDENFGEEFDNEEIRNLLNEAKQVLAETRIAAAAVEKQVIELKRLSGISDRLLKSVIEIEKTFKS
jgi:hypothetical protein